jgi:phosphate/sulfate permease
MRSFSAAVLLCASFCATRAYADDEDVKLAAGIGGGAVILTYGTVQTLTMIDELMKKGYSEPQHTVPVGFFAAGSIIASAGWFVNAYQSRSPISMTGSIVAGMASATVMLFFAMSVHGWLIRQPPVDNGS